MSRPTSTKEKTRLIALALFIGGVVGSFYLLETIAKAEPQPASVTPVDYVIIRIWHDATQQFTEVEESGCRFDSGKKNVVIVHGMGENTSTAWVQKMAQRIREREPETNIIGIDWSNAQRQDSHAAPEDSQTSGEKNSLKQLLKEGFAKIIREQLPQTITDRLPQVVIDQTLDRALDQVFDTIFMPIETANRIPVIATQADNQLFGDGSLNLDPSKTHVISFSHGCHIAGMMGMRHLDNPIGRLTVLDPSTRIVHPNPSNLFGFGWDKKRAAKFIDMYASSTLAGTKKPYGHKTYFVTGKKEPFWIDGEWLTPVTYHKYAAKWFLSTIGNNDTRFGYSIDVTHNPDSEWSGTIRSSLPRKGKLYGVDDEITNEIEPYHKKEESTVK